MQNRHILAIRSRNATKSRKLARTVRRNQSTDAITNTSIAVRSISGIQLVRVPLPFEPSFGDEIEKCELIVLCIYRQLFFVTRSGGDGCVESDMTYLQARRKRT